MGIRAVLVVLVLIAVSSLPVVIRLLSEKRLLRNVLLSIALVQIFAAFAIPVLMAFAVGLGKLHIIDVYVELERSGVIDRVKLRDVAEGRYARYWDLPDNLQSRFDVVDDLSLGIAALCLATGTGLLGIWWRFRKPSAIEKLQLQ